MLYLITDDMEDNDDFENKEEKDDDDVFANDSIFCNIHLYADDVKIYASAYMRNLTECVNDINHDLERIENWAARNELKINPSKSKCLVIHKSGINLSQELHIHIKHTAINIVSSATNLGITFNDRLTWTNHIQHNIAKTYGMLRNLWAVQSSTPLQIRMLLAKTYLIPDLLHGVEIFANCNRADMQRLNVVYNSIARYVFKKRRYDRISAFAYQLLDMSLENLIKYKCLVFLQKIIYTAEPKYVYERLQFSRSNRGKRITQLRYKYTRSEQQFLIPSIRLWNNLPTKLQLVSNTLQFKKELKEFYILHNE
ncbi:uncharacterized protein LOC142225697 [Haematobia irritans]|uniref:uncharacterized protein LOC142225697 n=1 Tax=Haematobia irritans TaxID=7368 RepID=UPI003F50409D